MPLTSPIVDSPSGRLFVAPSIQSPLVDVRRETPSISTLLFHLGDEELDYRPGQLTSLGLPGDGGPHHSVNLSSSPTETGFFAVTAKHESADSFHRRLFDLDPGDRVEVGGAWGDFTLDTTRPAVMVAGGIGVAPFRGMIRYAVDHDLDLPMVLVYSAPTAEDLAFQRELEWMVNALPSVRVVYTLTRDAAPSHLDARNGRVDCNLLCEVAEDLDRPVFYLSAPPKMMRGLQGCLEDVCQVSRRDIRRQVTTLH